LVLLISFIIAKLGLVPKPTKASKVAPYNSVPPE
jgi:hypothetical protein